MNQHIVRSLVGLCCLIFLMIVTGCDSSPVQLTKGEPVPEFRLPRLDGSQLSYSAEHYQGRVVIIEFWADWCALCRDELIQHEQLYQQFNKQGLDVLAINIEQSHEIAAEFIAGLGISYEVLLDKQGTVARSFGVLGLPVTYVIDRQGNLFSRVIGGSNGEQLQKLISELI